MSDVPNPKSLEEVVIDYTNWKGERQHRRIRPHYTIFTRMPPYHPGRGWLLCALDLDKNAMRFFAMKNIHSWTEPNA